MSQTPRPDAQTTVPSADEAVGPVDALKALSVPEVIGRLRRGLATIDQRVFELSEEQLDRSFDPEHGLGRWSVRVVLGHLADADLVIAHRIRRTLAEDHPVLNLFDEDAFVASGIYGGPSESGREFPAANVGAYVAIMYTMREWLGIWLAQLDESSWGRTAMHPENGPTSVKDFVAYMAWHLERHAWFVNRKVECMLGPAPARAEGGCCGGQGATSEGGCGGGGCGCQAGPGEASA